MNKEFALHLLGDNVLWYVRKCPYFLQICTEILGGQSCNLWDFLYNISARKKNKSNIEKYE